MRLGVGELTRSTQQAEREARLSEQPGFGLALAVLLIGWAVSPVAAAEEPVDKWEPAIRAFEEQDVKSPPMKGANLFVGSSSVRMWKVGEAFPGVPCLNRGFGGSQLGDVAKYVDRIVIPYQPRVIVLYAGDNDLAKERTPEQVRDSYREIVAKVRGALPETKIVWVTIKPSPSRWKLREEALKANALIRAEIAAGKNLVEVDIWDAMLGSDGTPRTELFVKDQLHLSPAGYAIWNERVRPQLAPGP
jgi:lysophospholipase L1-like esterase